MSRDLFKVKKGLSIKSVTSYPSDAEDGDIVFRSDLSSLQIYKNGAWGPVGPAGGGSGKNYLSGITTSQSLIPNVGNGDFELGSTSGWSLFNTTVSGSLPTGSIAVGAASLTSFSAIAAGQLAGSYSLQVGTSSGTAWGSGQGFISDAFYIDNEDQAKVLTVKAYYKATSGASNLNWSGTTANNLALAIYDVTNSAWIQPAGTFGFTQSSGAGFLTATFQTTSTSTQYRVAVLNVNGTAAGNTGATTVVFDDFYIGPQTAPIGSAVTDWQSYQLTPTATTTNPTFGTVAENEAAWRRVGGDMEIVYTYRQTSAGAAGNGLYLFPLPPGYSMDTTRISLPSTLPVTTTIGYGMTQVGNGYDSTTSAVNTNFAKNGMVFPYNSTNLFIVNETSGAMQKAALSSSNVSSNFSLNPWYITFKAKVPIAGWSSNVQMSSDTDTRVVALVSRSSTAQTVSTTVYKTFEIVDKDTHNAYDTSTGLYTTPVSGFYSIQGSLFNSTSLSGVHAYVVKNGVNIAPASQFSVNSANSSIFSTTIYCDAGDTLGIKSSSPLVTNTSSSGNTLAIHRVSGPSVIAASETVAASYWLSANFAASTTVPINFDSKELDTHGAVTTSATAWRFQAPSSGTYQIGGYFTSSSSAYSTLILYKNGAAYKAISYSSSTAPFPNSAVSGLIRLNAGDYIDFRPNLSATISGGLLSANISNISIVRIGF